MGKIICEICGTVYPATAQCCPICGYTQDPLDMAGFLSDEPMYRRDRTDEDLSAGLNSSEETFVLEEDPAPEADCGGVPYAIEQQQIPRPNYFLVILLVIIITLLLTATFFLFFRFYLPNHRAESPQTEATLVQTEPTETTQPEIPCQSLTLTSGVTELNREGQLWLLHVNVLPADTTDPLIFYSEDETVVTVTQEGRLCAVGEGETYVHILCGAKEIKCSVVVRYVEQILSTEETYPDVTAPAYTEETLPPDATIETQPQQVSATQPAEQSGEVVLKLKQTDVTSTKRGVSFDLELDCDLKPEDVKWLTLDSTIAIVRNGTVTTVGAGSTKIVAQYNGQQVECIVRCNF